jgi:sarcosine oxidase gamma subunit
LSGTILDVTGAGIAGASVELTSKSSGAQRKAISAAEGVYAVPQLGADTYTVKASSPGFADQVAEVVIGPGQNRVLTFNLNVAAQSATVEVVETASAVDVSSARTGVNVTAREVEQMPLNGRTYSLLTLAAPGATNTTDGAFDKIRFNGKATEQNSFRYDGVDASAVFDAAPGWLTVSGSQFRLQNSVETVQEFRVDSALYPAEYGTGTGGQINLISKTGTNVFRGALFEYLRNDKMDARNFFDNDKSSLRLNQFGGNLGGRIIKDKLFFFGAFEALRQRAALNVIETVPSAAARSRAVPAVQSLLGAFPVGFRSTGNPDIDLARRSAVSKLDETNFSGRIDWAISSNHRFYTRYLKDIGELDAPDNTVTPRRIRSTYKPDNFVASLNSVIGTKAVNDLSFGVNRAPTTLLVNAGVPGLEGVAINISGSIVQPGVNGGAPSGVAAPGGTTRQSSAGNGRGSDYRGKTFSIIDNLAYIVGRHQFKTGFEFRAIRIPMNQLGGLTYSYSNLAGFLSNTGATVAYIGDLGFRVGHQQYYIGYFQDEFRVKPNLTINAGLRYEFYTTNREKNNRIRLFDAGCVCILPSDTPMYKASKNNWAPRFGMTWSPNALENRTVFRVGGGLFYGPGQYEDLIQPIESDVDRFSLANQVYPVNINIIISGPRPAQTPRAYDVSGYIHPERNVQFGASVQQELFKSWVAQIGFVGSLGRQLFQRSITNRIIAVNPATGAVTRQNPAFGEIDYKTSGGRDTYKALQLGLTRRYTNGLSFSMQYSFAHSYGTSQGSNEALTVQDPFCFICERGDGPADIRHYAYLNALYELPFGPGRKMLASGPASHIFGGWSLGGIWSGRTGLPINAFVVRTDVVNVDAAGRVTATSGTPAAGSTAVINTPGGGASRATRRPNIVPGVDPYIKDRRTLQWLNPAAFSIPKPGEYGNLPRNALRGPAFRQFDTFISRRFRITETQRIEFRVDLYNLFNNVNFSSPPATLPNALPAQQPGVPFTALSAPGFGVITSTVGRTIGIGTSRQVQLGLRYSF